MSKVVYPATPTTEVTDNFYGTIVPDPYRWLEDADNPETIAWVEAQNKITQDYLNSPVRQAIYDRLKTLWNYPKYSAPFKEGSRYFFFKNDGLQNQAVLFVQESLNEEARVLMDPNKLSTDGTIALTNLAISRDAHLMAYGLSQSGSDQQTIHIRNIETGEDYNEVLQWCKFSSIAWKHNNEGFYYCRYPTPGTVAVEDENNYHRVYWHQLNTPQADDILVFEDPEAKEHYFTPSISDDGKYLILHVWRGTDTKNRLYFRPLLTNDQAEKDNHLPFVKLLDKADASYHFIDNDENIFYLHTDLNASHRRVVAIDINNAQIDQWREIIAEKEDVISFITMAQDQFIICYLHDAYHQMYVYDKQGTLLNSVPLPGIGSLTELSSKRRDKEIFFDFQSFTTPPTIYRYDITDNQVTIFRGPQIDFDFNNFVVQQKFYDSKDGTRIPIFLIHKKDLQLDGNNPTVLYGYGGFNISTTPSYSPSRPVWWEHGGITAIANIRGGGEYGEKWHSSGKLANKQNVFDDFIAAGEWLIAQGYTSSKRLAILGGSNGGLLVGACMTQRPDLFGAVLCQVPVLDMLRFHKFTIGSYWVPEYGNAEASEEEFKFLYAYSPLHNVKPDTEYPAILIATADTDDRVVPMHAKKFAATLQRVQKGDNPILLRVEMKAGHGSGKPTAKVLEEHSDIYAFLFDRFHIAF